MSAVISRIGAYIPLIVLAALAAWGPAAPARAADADKDFTIEGVADPGYLKEHFGLDIPFGSAFAWNPSGVGVKSEDTFLLLPDGTREIVSETSSLPQVHLDERIGRPVEAVKSGMAE